MVHLTDLVGRVVTTSSGTRLGAVRDLVVRAGGAEAPVTRVLLGDGDEPTVGVTAADVVAWTAAELTVADDVEPDPLGRGITIEVDDDELLLARDVLDTQVVDVPGRFLVRVADVSLREGDSDGIDGTGIRAAGSGAALTATGIDLSVGAKLSRDGFQRLAGRRGQRSIPWDDLHLTSTRGRAAQLATRTPLLDLTGSELARVLPKLSSTHVSEVLAVLPPPQLAATVAATPANQLRHLVEGLPEALLEPVLASMPPSRAATARRARRDLATRPRPRGPS